MNSIREFQIICPKCGKLQTILIGECISKTIECYECGREFLVSIDEGVKDNEKL